MCRDVLGRPWLWADALFIRAKQCITSTHSEPTTDHEQQTNTQCADIAVDALLTALELHDHKRARRILTDSHLRCIIPEELRQFTECILTENHGTLMMNSDVYTVVARVVDDSALYSAPQLLMRVHGIILGVLSV